MTHSNAVQTIRIVLLVKKTYFGSEMASSACLKLHPYYVEDPLTTFDGRNTVSTSRYFRSSLFLQFLIYYLLYPAVSSFCCILEPYFFLANYILLIVKK
jgi:hypothetical protein